MERRLGTRVILENDANAAALGEKWMGAGRDVDDLVLLTLGTGIGGGIISGGKVLHGYLGMAGELGHITVVPNGNPVRLRQSRLPGEACVGHGDRQPWRACWAWARISRPKDVLRPGAGGQ